MAVEQMVRRRVDFLQNGIGKTATGGGAGACA